MNRPNRALAAVLAVSLSSWAVIALAIRLARRDGVPLMSAEGSWHQAVIGVALVPAIVATLALFRVAEGWALDRRLRRPGGHFARWTIRPAVWEQFRALDGGRGANLLSRSLPCPPEGIEVLAGPGSIAVGPAFFRLEPRGASALRSVSWAPGAPETLCFGYRVLVRLSSAGLGHSAFQLRIPVSPEEREAAERAFHRYRGVIVTNRMVESTATRIAVRVLAALGVAGLVAGAAGAVMEAQDLPDPGSALPAWLGLIGTLGGAGALILATVTWRVMLRPVRRRR